MSVPLTPQWSKMDLSHLFYHHHHLFSQHEKCPSIPCSSSDHSTFPKQQSKLAYSLLVPCLLKYWRNKPLKNNNWPFLPEDNTFMIQKDLFTRWKACMPAIHESETLAVILTETAMVSTKQHKYIFLYQKQLNVSREKPINVSLVDDQPIYWWINSTNTIWLIWWINAMSHIWLFPGY